MSETIATRMVATVSPVRRLGRVRVVGPVLVALAAAEAGARLLAPREDSIEPARVAAEDYFTTQEIGRGARFARPQLAIGIARSALELGALATVVRRLRPRRAASRRRS